MNWPEYRTRGMRTEVIAYSFPSASAAQLWRAAIPFLRRTHKRQVKVQMYSKDFDRSFCSESDILRGLVGSMDTDRVVLHEVCWRPEGKYIRPEFVGGEV